MTKKIISLSLIILAVFIGCNVQKETTKSASKTEGKSKLGKYLNTISTDQLRTNLTYIASDETEGRETGSEGQKKAGKFMIDFYKKKRGSFS